MLFLLFLGSLPAMAQRKHAMMIGVGHYAPETGWNDLHSKNDIPLLEQALRNRGFEERHIHSYVDRPMGREEILAEMEKVMILGTSPGDIVFFHFSGHGQQIADDDGDEESDGLDEALVPYDAPRYNTYADAAGTPGREYDYSRHLRDDALGEIFTKIRRHLGPKGNLFVSLDACHSGSASRGFAPSRGSDCMNVPPGWKRPAAARSATMGPAGEEDTSFGLVSDHEGQAPMVCFFASRASQQNHEYRMDSLFYGSLSFALASSLHQIASDGSYRALFDLVRIRMATMVPMQQPSYDGDLDQVFLRGTLLKPVRYANPVQITKGNVVTLNKGGLANFHPGSVVGFFPPDTREASGTTPFATGTITAASAEQARVLLDAPVRKKDLLTAWAIVVEQSFGKFSTGIHLEGLGAEFHQGLQRHLESKGMMFVSILQERERADIVLSRHGDSLVITTCHGLTLGRYGHEELARCTDRILEYTQAKYLRGLHEPNPRYHAAIDVIFHQVDPATRMSPPKDRKYLIDDSRAILSSDSGSIRLGLGDLVSLRFRNLTKNRSHYSLISLTSDYRFGVDALVYPLAGEQPEDHSLEALGVVERPEILTVGPPEGTDIWLLIVSREPQDLRPVLGARGKERAGDGKGPLSELFARGITGSRGEQVDSAPTAHLGIYRIPVVIGQTADTGRP